MEWTKIQEGRVAAISRFYSRERERVIVKCKSAKLSLFKVISKWKLNHGESSNKAGALFMPAIILAIFITVMRVSHRVIRGGSTWNVRYIYGVFSSSDPVNVNRNEMFTHCRVILSPANWLSYDATTTWRRFGLRGLPVQSATTTRESWFAR